MMLLLFSSFFYNHDNYEESENEKYYSYIEGGIECFCINIAIYHSAGIEFF